jgi:adenylate kinase
VVRERLGRDDAAAGFILDGYPRTICQANTLDAVLSGGERGLGAVVLLDVPEDVLVRRALARRRADDREEVVRQRLTLYREKTEPLIEHYGRRGLLVRIDGNRAVDEVTDAVLRVLKAV